MATTSPDNIWTPDPGTSYVPTVDLMATADSIQAALVSIRNGVRTYTGTRAQRNAALATTAEGSFWNETDNLRGTYVKRGGTWVPPAPPYASARFRRSDNTLNINAGTNTLMRFTSVPVNTMGAVSTTSANGAGLLVPEPGLYQLSISAQVALSGWTIMYGQAGTSPLVGGQAITETNGASGYQLLSLQALYFVSDTTQPLNCIISSNDGGSFRTDGTLTVTKLPNLW